MFEHEEAQDQEHEQEGAKARAGIFKRSPSVSVPSMNKQVYSFCDYEASMGSHFEHPFASQKSSQGHSESPAVSEAGVGNHFEPLCRVEWHFSLLVQLHGSPQFLAETCWRI